MFPDAINYKEIFEYASPEKIEGDARSLKEDSWALGMIIYRLCTLKYPFISSTSVSLIK